MKSRRAVLLGVGAGAIGGLAGCLDLIQGEELEFEAEPATADQSVAGDYEHQQTESFEIEEDVEVSDESRTVRVTSWVDNYAKDGGPGGAFTVALFSAIATPAFEVLGQSANPVESMDHAEMIEEFNDEFDQIDEIEDVQLKEESQEELLGEVADLSILEATVNIDGQEADALLYVTSTMNEDDIVLAVGGHVDDERVEEVTDDPLAEEEDAIRELIQSVEHPVDRPE